MYKYVFTVRGHPIKGVIVNEVVDCTPFIGMQKESDLDQLTAVTKRLDPDDKTEEELHAKLRWLQNQTGSMGDLRRRANTNERGPFMVNWEEDEPLDFDKLDAYLQALTPEQREAFYKEARF